MEYAKNLSQRLTPQSAKLPGTSQVANSAGGFTWKLDAWGRLDRLLILGTEGGTFYVGERELTIGQAENAIKLIQTDGESVVQRVCEISESGRAPKNDPAIFVLALAAAFGDAATKRAAFEVLPKVARTGAHLLKFAAEADELRGWGRAMRRAVGSWYVEQTPAQLAYQSLKYQQRNGWTQRDLLRLAHPKAPTSEHDGVFKWITQGDADQAGPQIEAFEKLKRIEDIAEAAELIVEHRLPREAIPTQMLNEPEVWEALLQNMPMTAMIRNLATMSRVGLLTRKSKAEKEIVGRLTDASLLRRARVHPLQVLIALRTYASGHGLRGRGTWSPVRSVTDALDGAFYKAFASVEPTGKRIMLAIDVSASMGWTPVAGSPMTAAEGAAAMAMVTLATENDVQTMGFAHTFKTLGLTAGMPLNTALKKTRKTIFGATDCALPMQNALKQSLEIDLFVVLTDNETWYGKQHPSEALLEYRRRSGIDAKLAVVAMAANPFSIADPEDPGMMDFVGFDASIPQALREFALA